VDEGGYENPRWWEGLPQHEAGPGERGWHLPNYPRVSVSWYSAMAFCRWLGTQLGAEVRLPTQLEWEKAARGTSGNIYPWGMKYIPGYSNINESLSGLSANYLRQPVAVGVYPHAVSPYGVYDMIGNVWEWCLNEFHNAASIEAGGEDPRMLCGGSWDSDRLFAHTARRRGEHPGARFTDIGFRVARGAPD